MKVSGVQNRVVVLSDNVGMNNPYRPFTYPGIMNTCMALLSLLLCLTGIANAEAGSDYLFGDWGGKRNEMVVAGFRLEQVATIDLLSNVSGGMKRGFEAPGNLDIVLTVDTDEADWWSGGTFALYVLGNSGGDISGSRVGDFQAVSNIEADNTFKIYEAWYQHNFLDDRLSLLMGLHDYNSEFDALEYAGLFMNSSFGISPDISQVGPSIFSTTSLAVRLAWQPTERSYFLGAVYDGVPGDPDDPSGTHIILKKTDGIFYGIEAGLIAAEGDDDYYKLGIGAWYHTAEFDDFSGAAHNRNSGVYLIGEKQIHSEDDAAQGLGAFVQLGFTRSDRNQVDLYTGFGINYVGLFPHREDDVFGLAIAHAGNGSGFRGANPTADAAETAIEVTYLMPIFSWGTIQPTLQYIVNPGMDPDLDNAVVVGIRIQMGL